MSFPKSKHRPPYMQALQDACDATETAAKHLTTAILLPDPAPHSLAAAIAVFIQAVRAADVAYNVPLVGRAPIENRRLQEALTTIYQLLRERYSEIATHITATHPGIPCAIAFANQTLSLCQFFSASRNPAFQKLDWTRPWNLSRGLRYYQHLWGNNY